MVLEKSIKEKLANVDKVPKELCEAYSRIYNEEILPRIQEKFLAHLVSVVEDLIFGKIKKDNPKACPYKIILWKDKPINGKAVMKLWENGAIIAYNPQNDYHDLRIFISHELGHLLCQYKILDGDPIDNNANLFAYFAINGKDVFYKNKAHTLIYPGGELEIISHIQAVCPII